MNKAKYKDQDVMRMTTGSTENNQHSFTLGSKVIILRIKGIIAGNQFYLCVNDKGDLQNIIESSLEAWEETPLIL